ncbi:MAG TPA: hypothetical protein VNA12_09940 [Mycobacteriales bacterium]|nr:hypothetical protein [Mycobacteriales bacterium]
MSFIQIIEYRTSRLDEIRELSEKFQGTLEESGLSGGPVRITITQDRDKPGTYRTIVEFESYEVAMENSARPQTSAWAEAFGQLVDGPPTFYNLDVVESITP